MNECSVLCFDCLFLCFLPHYTISSIVPLFHALFVTSPYYVYLFKVHIVSLSVTSLSGCSVRGFDCLFLCSLRHCSISSRFQLLHYLFVTSLPHSRFRRSLPLHFSVRAYVTRLSMQGFHCIIICLLQQCSVPVFDCPFLFLLLVTIYSGYFHVIILSLHSSMFPLFY